MNNLKKAHQFIKDNYLNLNHCVDMTCGNGHDTFFLASISKKVSAIDIQEKAILNTKKRLKSFNNVSYYLEDHSKINIEKITPIDGVIYNLGYLPHGDKSIITKKESTIQSLDQVYKHINKFLVITCYPGHAGGDTEAEAIKSWIIKHNLKPLIYTYDKENSPITYCIDLSNDLKQ